MTRAEIEARIKTVEKMLAEERHPAGLASLNKTLEKLIMMKADDE